MQSLIPRLTLLCAFAGLLFAASCKRNDDNNGITPRGTAPAWAPSISNKMLAIIEELDSLHPYPVDSVSPVVARTQPTIFDAATSLAKRYGISGQVYTTDATDYAITANGTQLNTRIYRPHGAGGPFACIVYFHGGGWVIGDS